jgi:primosomal protein N' (replication factor Y)
VLHPFPALPPDLLGLARWMTGYYAAPLDGIIETMIPVAVRNGAGLKQEKQLALGQRLTTEELAALEKRAPQQARLYKFIEQQFRPQKKSLVLSRLDITAAVANALVKRGALKEASQRIERVAYADDHSKGELVAAQPPKLNPTPPAVGRRRAAPLTAEPTGRLVPSGAAAAGRLRATCFAWQTHRIA